MKTTRKFLPLLIGCCGLLTLILDSKTAFSGGLKGIELCFRSLIPALFPFIFLSVWLRGHFSVIPAGLLRPIGKICRIPKGSESLMLIGLLGGYPVGAQVIHEAWKEGELDSANAERMLGFCSIAGPSFLFGVMGQLLPLPSCWMLWFTQILSAIIAGMLLPKTNSTKSVTTKWNPISLPGAFHNALRTMAVICGWAVLFRVLISVLDRWIFWAFPAEIRIFLMGCLELSNGCTALSAIPDPAVIFVLSAGILSLGSMCVYMQTKSVIGQLKAEHYLIGKLLQGAVSTSLSIIILPLAVPASSMDLTPYLLFSCLLTAIITISIHRKKIVVAFLRKPVYNSSI